MAGGQLDLFGGGGLEPDPDDTPRTEPPAVRPESLDDATLIAAVADAVGARASALAAEASRRRLQLAVPALESLCRRFKGFGLVDPAPEQVAALRGLAAIGGAAAADAVARIGADGVVQAPGVAAVFAAAASLGSRLPPGQVVEGLRHADPVVRADACRCARPSATVSAVLIDLLADLHDPVALAAACALARMGHAEARPMLIRHLLREPTEAVIAAIAEIADEDTPVLLARIAAARPDLRDAVLEALEEIDTPRAALVADGLRRRLGD